MTSEEIYELLDALDALTEKCLEGYHIRIEYDPEIKGFWLRWAPPISCDEVWSGRGVQGPEQAFTTQSILHLVREFLKDAERIKNLREFQKHYDDSKR